MVVVEPNVTEEKVRQLLAEETESESLDYKETLDLLAKRDQIELAKDIGAMQMRGGYIVVGADDHGRLTERLTREKAALFDEARVRGILGKFIPEPFSLLVAHHVIDGREVAVIYTGQNADCLAVFKADGQYEVNGKTVSVFRAGEVFARHGTASERWRQEDVAWFRQCISRKEKEEWRREFADEVERIRSGAAGQRLAAGPAAAFTWRVDAETFRATAIELVRANDLIPLRLLFGSITTDARKLATSAELDSEFATLVDRTAALAALGIEIQSDWLVISSIDTLGRIYELGSARAVAGHAAQLWLTVLLRIYAIGALAVRDANWQVVRSLSLRRAEPDGSPEWYRSWLRHGLTMAARSNLFDRVNDDKKIKLSLISLVVEVIRAEPSFRPDVTPDDDEILNSVCQFDALSALTVMGDVGVVDSRYFYTSFARFHSYRTEPAIAKLIRDSEMKAILWPRSDDELAHALRVMNEFARRESFRYNGWGGFDHPIVTRFLELHPEPGT